MTVTLTNPGSGDSITLWNAQRSSAENKGNMNIVAPYGEDSDEAVLTGLENQEEVTLTGITTARRVSNTSGFSSDMTTALAEWVVKFMSFHNAGQGDGLELSETYRGRTITGAISNVSWQRNKGEAFEVTWAATFKLGRAEMNTIAPSPPSVSPHNSPVLEGNDLYEIESYREVKKQDIKIYPIALADPQDNDALAQSGVQRQVIVTGRVPGSQATRNTFDSTMRSYIGNDTTITIDPGFPGRGTPLEVMIRSFESTRKAGMTRLGEYALMLVEGHE